jgi:hypothetical protein
MTSDTNYSPLPQVFGPNGELIGRQIAKLPENDANRAGIIRHEGETRGEKLWPGSTTFQPLPNHPQICNVNH